MPDEQNSITADQAFEIGLSYAQSGRLNDAISIFGQILQIDPDGFQAFVARAQCFEQLGQLDQALSDYESAIRILPGHALPFTRRALIKLRLNWGPPLPPRASIASKQVICNSSIGQLGRFGNQLLQYGFLRIYAARHDLEIWAPDWVGRDLFDLDDPLPERALPQLQEANVDFIERLGTEMDASLAGHDLIGYFQGNSARYAPYRHVFRSAFKWGSRVNQILKAWDQVLKVPETTLIAVHLRRGDFGSGQFWIAPVEWYLTWLERIWPCIKNPVLYIASDDPSLINEFEAYFPISSRDLGAIPDGIEFLGDFYALSSADYIAISNSSFSFVASMLNEKADSFLRPDRNLNQLVEFDPWDAPVLLD